MTDPRADSPCLEDHASDAWDWFSRLFAVAVIAHLTGNPSGWKEPDAWITPLGAASGVLALLSLALLARPDRRVLAATAATVLVTVWFEAPFIGNHWLVVGFVAVAVLVSLTRQDSWLWLSVTGRWILLGFYSFAAFSKLNTGFLDPTVSCGVFYANQSLASFGLPGLRGDSVMGMASIAAPLLVELSVPVLLAFTRTRRLGVLLATVFHSVISLDLHQHFYDFTAVVIMLVFLFLPSDTLATFERRARGRSLIRTLALMLTSVVALATVLPPSLWTVVIVVIFGFAVWIPFAIWLIVRTAQTGLGASSVTMRLPGVAAWVIVAVVVANGLTPYLELKTSTSFNMYSNLVTQAGETNHLIVRRTLRLSKVQDQLLEVVDSNDADMRKYADESYLIPERNLLDYLARNPSVTVTVTDDDGERTLTGQDGIRLPTLVHKFQAFRAIDERTPPRCQPVWLPAR